jgi:hypothetical protein
MGTIIINGKRFEGNDVTIRDGKVVIDGKPQDGELHGDVELQVVEGVFGSAECVASVTCGEVWGNVAAGASVTGENVGGSIQAGGSVTAGDRAGGAIQAVAFALADNGLRKTKKR